MDPGEEVRKMIFEKLHSGERPAKIARDFGVNPKRIYRTKGLFEATRNVKRRYGHGPAPQKRTGNGIQALKARILD